MPGIRPPKTRTRRPGPSPQASPGAAAVEFALVLPLFLALLFGIVEFGLVMHAKGIITQASREGARFGVLYSLNPRSQDDIKGHVYQYLLYAGFTHIAPDNITVTAADSGTAWSVKVDYPYQFTVLPDFISGLVGEITLSADTVMRRE